MKLQLTISILISLVTITNGQMKDTSYFDGCNWTTCKGGACMTTAILCADIDVFDTLIWEGDGEIVEWQDSLQAERFFTDSIGNQYMVEYRYAYDRKLTVDTLSDTTTTLHHYHYVANCKIIKYNGNRQTTIMKNIKAIYSPTPCSADNVTLWKQKINEYLKGKK